MPNPGCNSNHAYNRRINNPGNQVMAKTTQYKNACVANCRFIDNNFLELLILVLILDLLTFSSLSLLSGIESLDGALLNAFEISAEGDDGKSRLGRLVKVGGRAVFSILM